MKINKNWDVNNVTICFDFHTASFNSSGKMPNFTNCNPD